MNPFVDMIRAANEPSKLALEMLQAVAVHVQDLQDDDPGDNDAATLRRIRRLHKSLGDACLALKELV